MPIHFLFLNVLNVFDMNWVHHSWQISWSSCSIRIFLQCFHLPVAKVHSSHRPPAGPSAGRPRRRGNARQLAPVQWFQRRSGQGQRGAHVVAPLPGTQGTQGLKGSQGPHGVTTTLCIHGMKLRYGKWWWSVMLLLDFWLLKVSRFQVTCHTKKVMLKRGGNHAVHLSFFIFCHLVLWSCSPAKVKELRVMWVKQLVVVPKWVVYYCFTMFYPYYSCDLAW
jgi:hypothetical protein